MARSRPEKKREKNGAGNRLCRLSARHLDQSDGSFTIMVAQASIITANAPKGTRYLRSARRRERPRAPRPGRSVGYCRASRWAVVAIAAFIARRAGVKASPVTARAPPRSRRALLMARS